MNTTNISQIHTRIWRGLLFTSVIALAIAFAGPGKARAAEAPEVKGPPVPSLVTATPEAGFALAVKLSQKGVVYTQPDGEARGNLRDQYANNPDSLVAVSHVIAVHFQTIAAANDYWRD